MTHKNRLLLCGIVIAIRALSTPVQASDADYQQGMRALQAKDCAQALNSLEQAVAGDPDNLRYANDYRQAIIRCNDKTAYDRELQFFEKLAAQHPNAANLHLNYGFAYVDKIPVAGSITQVILANNALIEFSKAVDLQPNWIDYYTRGASYLFWPKVFLKAQLGVADLQKALELQQKSPRRSYYVKAYIALGDGYWKIDNPKKARSVWQAGLKEFPNDAILKARLALRGDKLKAAIEDSFDPDKRVDTNLKDLWSEQPGS